jgi:hypothetical protein
MGRFALLFCVSVLSYAAEPNPYFCNASVQADAFLDWSKLPPPPDTSSTSSFTAVIPVNGALTAEVSFF